MKRKLLILIGIGACALLSGCGAVPPASTEFSGFVTEQETGVLPGDATEAAEAEKTTEEPDPEGTVRTTAEDLKKLPAEIQEIFFGIGKFYDTGEKKEFTWKSFQVTDSYDGISDSVRGGEFLVSDIDMDGEQELLVYLMPRDPERGSIDGEVRIFDLSKGTVYAHPHCFRGSDVYPNGIMGGASSASDYDWYRISFDGEKETETVLAFSRRKGNSDNTAYYIGHGEVVREETRDLSREISREEYCAYIMQLLDAPAGDDIPADLRILWSNEHLSDIIE